MKDKQKKEKPSVKQWVLDKAFEAGLVDEKNVMFRSAFMSAPTKKEIVGEVVKNVVTTFLFGGYTTTEAVPIYASLKENKLNIIQLFSKKTDIEKMISGTIAISAEDIEGVRVEKKPLGMTYLYMTITDMDYFIVFNKKDKQRGFLLEVLKAFGKEDLWVEKKL
ncbi:MAG: hypothetical protein FWE03_04730 [Firmicutes bacterium]|nr:hypothetical protein [Bacillota bacterium]